jgi:hypothetical protein
MKVRKADDFITRGRTRKGEQAPSGNMPFSRPLSGQAPQRPRLPGPSARLTCPRKRFETERSSSCPRYSNHAARIG